MADTQIRLTRAQLAEFLPDSRAIKTFEQLMLATGTTLPDSIVELERLVDEVTLDAGTADSKADLALSLLSSIEANLAMVTLSPANIPDEPPITAGTTAQYWRGDKAWRDFMTDVRATTLTGLSTAVNAVITAADTVLSALGKLQKQFSDHFASTVEHGATGAVVGTTNAQILTNKTLTAPIIAQISNTGTLTLPTSTDTLIGKATTDVLTNKTYDTAGAGNIFKINGTGISAVIGTGSAVLATSPTLTTPNIGVATGTSLSVTGQLTSTVATGTAPLVVSSTTNIANLNASTLSGATFASPGPIGGTVASTSAFTTITASDIVSITQSNTNQYVLLISNNGVNGVGLRFTGDGANPSKTMRATGGKLQIISDGYAANIFDLDNNGLLIIPALTITGITTITTPVNVAASVPTVASAGTIAITTPIAFVSGVAAINTITAPAGLTNGGQITIIPTGLFTTTVAGNIALASTAVVSKALIMTYSASTSKWYPSY